MTPLEQATAALDAFRAEREAYPRDCNHGRLARKCDACDADEEFLLREEWQARADEWRARALAAEAALANAQGMEGLAVSMWNEVETAARSAASGDDEPPRSVATDCGLDLFLCVQNALADAEARGRQHGLLAAAWRLTTIADGIEGTAVAPTAQRAMREAARVVVALATESA